MKERRFIVCIQCLNSAAQLMAVWRRYLSHQVALPVTMTAVGVALQCGNLECLKLLLDRQPAGRNGLPNPNKQFTKWELSPVRVAAKRGFAECVAFAGEHGCPPLVGWYAEMRSLPLNFFRAHLEECGGECGVYEQFCFLLC